MTVLCCHRQAPSDATFWCSHMRSSCDAWRGNIHPLRMVLSRGLGRTSWPAKPRPSEAGININYGYCGAEAGYGSAILFSIKGRGRNLLEPVNRTTSDCESSK
jgi:hypothetical protein